MGKEFNQGKIEEIEYFEICKKKRKLDELGRTLIKFESKVFLTLKI